VHYTFRPAQSNYSYGHLLVLLSTEAYWSLCFFKQAWTSVWASLTAAKESLTFFWKSLSKAWACDEAFFVAFCPELWMLCWMLLAIVWPWLTIALICFWKLLMTSSMGPPAASYKQVLYVK
jgi:hypothetical protein